MIYRCRSKNDFSLQKQKRCFVAEAKTLFRSRSKTVFPPSSSAVGVLAVLVRGRWLVTHCHCGAGRLILDQLSITFGLLGSKMSNTPMKMPPAAGQPPKNLREPHFFVSRFSGPRPRAQGPGPRPRAQGPGPGPGLGPRPRARAQAQGPGSGPRAQGPGPGPGARPNSCLGSRAGYRCRSKKTCFVPKQK